MYKTIDVWNTTLLNDHSIAIYQTINWWKYNFV